MVEHQEGRNFTNQVVESYYRTTVKQRSLKADCMAGRLNLYTCGNGTENTGVVQYICPCSVLILSYISCIASGGKRLDTYFF